MPCFARARRYEFQSNSLECIRRAIVPSGLRPYALRIGGRWREQNVMRCMACGGEMAAAAPDEAVTTAGLRHQSYRCLVCGSTERRLAFHRSAAGPTVVHRPRQDLPSLPPKANTSGRAWESAINKLRSHQADLHARADDAAKLDWNAQFNAAWESLGPARREQPPEESAPAPTAKERARLAGRLQRARLRGSPSARHRKALPPLPVEASPESIQRFNRFWDNLAPGGHELVLPAQSSSTSSQPLPQSMSLVPIEILPAISAAARALSLLRVRRDQHAR
jgi:hypothetical protein